MTYREALEEFTRIDGGEPPTYTPQEQTNELLKLVLLQLVTIEERVVEMGDK